MTFRFITLQTFSLALTKQVLSNNNFPYLTFTFLAYRNFLKAHSKNKQNEPFFIQRHLAIFFSWKKNWRLKIVFFPLIKMLGSFVSPSHCLRNTVYFPLAFDGTTEYFSKGTLAWVQDHLARTNNPKKWGHRRWIAPPFCISFPQHRYF